MRPTPATGRHVVLGTGQVGQHVAAQLVDADADVQVVNRSGAAPDAIADEVSVQAADLSVPDQAREACADAAVVYFCVQPPYHRWPELFPPLVRATLDAADAADATFVMADDLYMYGPVEGPIHEDLPYAAAGSKGEVRAEMAETVLDAHESGRVRATIGRASDFYGPGVTGSIVGDRVFPNVLDGSTVWFPGDPDVPHSYTYIEDFARALVTLGASDAALGEAWHVPSDEPITTREFVEVAGEIVGTEPTVRELPGWILRLAGLAIRPLAELEETRYQITEPFEVSHEKFAAKFDVEPTAYREGIERTLDWYESEY
ncbi:NAD-dependent epimerase/dehydratase [Salinarchaeum sp. Harcht-Bsk1]|uniref:NAD-dependent epimerase/dehydratase family protein n=1 Tax=Salinarchaeum sp. Harcht-Bsk1 TaxID=1333523 RepID=UPI00034244B8|nr:NAD-dependent epimerase/dehydratase family protein [Salinarchaeum sp. Harcht-Bsk1]AGN02943.1 NAD-dependent epimerase/dehydratase [Salinarchaeum sp. Harcht-Bsk1]